MISCEKLMSASQFFLWGTDTKRKKTIRKLNLGIQQLLSDTVEDLLILLSECTCSLSSLLLNVV